MKKITTNVKMRKCLNIVQLGKIAFTGNQFVGIFVHVNDAFTWVQASIALNALAICNRYPCCQAIQANA
jgi:hypothetical protein